MLVHSKTDIAKRFGVELIAPSAPTAPEIQPSLDLRPTNRVAIVRDHQPSAARSLDLASWRLIPGWVKDPKTFGFTTFNARCESLMGSAVFRNAFNKRRCLIPADAFYEWRYPAATKVRKNGTRVRFGLESGEMFSFAGLWEVWKPHNQPDAEWTLSCTIITTDANEVVASVHDRMPVMLRPEDEERWLDIEGLKGEEALAFLKPPYPAHFMRSDDQDEAMFARPKDTGPQLPLDSL
jgi:putative SOS response-associated peptidase YedK